MHRLIKLIVLASICQASFGASLNLAAPFPDEKAIVKAIFVEADSKERMNQKELKPIADFLCQKAQIALDYQDNPVDSVNIDAIIRLDEDNILVVLETYEASYGQHQGELFIINRHKNKWAPVEPSEVITTNLNYTAPILSTFRTTVGWYHMFGVADDYLYEDGEFKLIRSVETSLDEQKMKAEGIDHGDPNFFCADFEKKEVLYVDPKEEWRFSEKEERLVSAT